MRLFTSEVRVHPGRVAGAAVACAVTAAGVGACLVLMTGVSGTGYAENSAAAATADSAQDLLSLLLTLLLMSAVLVTGSTVSLWTGQRLGQFAVLRALGVSARRLRAMAMLDVAALSLLSAVVGVGVGALPLARSVRQVMADNDLYPAAAGLPSPAVTVLEAAAVCVGTSVVAVVAALTAVLAAGRVRPIDLLKDEALAMAPSRRSPVRLGIGIALLVTTCLPLLVLMVVPMLPGMLKAALAPGLALVIIPVLAVLAPWYVPLLVRPLGGLLRLLDRRVGRIAAAGLRAAPVRTTAVAVPVLLAVGLAAAMLGAGATMGEAVRDQTERGLRADGVVSAEPEHRLPAGADATAFPGGTATPLVHTTVTAPKTLYDDSPEPVRAWGADTRALPGVLDLDVEQGRLDALTGSSFAAGATQVEGHHWKIGQTVRLRLADGSSHRLRLAAVYGRDLAFPEFLLPGSLAMAHTPDAYAEQILLRGGITSWSKAAGQEVASRSAYLADLAPRSPQDDLAAHLIVAVVSGYALLAVANTCALAQRDRRAQRAHLRALGLTRWQLLRCVLYESSGGAVVGVVLSALTALICLAPLAAALGVHAMPTFDLPWTLGVLGAVLAAAALASALSARPLRDIREQFAGSAS
ncbi:MULTISPECIES: FtsX-like permease family protein [unclassified Streptomyces]|uniref:FtsX-like permease family protein n=1 Tax=unclassified Streptomyces TaxID=2593676 RepID=UPI0035DB1C8B